MIINILFISFPLHTTPYTHPTTFSHLPGTMHIPHSFNPRVYLFDTLLIFFPLLGLINLYRQLLLLKVVNVQRVIIENELQCLLL